MPGRNLDPDVRALLDEVVTKFAAVHRLCTQIESGRAIADYLHAKHAIEVYLHDLEDAAT